MTPPPADPAARPAEADPTPPRRAAPPVPEHAAGLLARHCRQIAAEGAALLSVRRDGRVDIAGVHPSPQGDAAPPDWLTEALTAANAAAEGESVTVRPLHDADQLYGQPARRHLALMPVGSPRSRGVVAFAKETADADAFAAAVEKLDVHAPAGEFYGMCLAAGPAPRAAQQLAPALACLAAVNEHDRFLPAAMGFCNEVAARWQCDRVGLGFLAGGYVELQAMSHTEKFSRKTHVVQQIEAAMEECLDQDVEVNWPAGSDAEFVHRAARELSAGGGHTAVLSLPLRQAGSGLAVLTLERAAESPFTPEEAESLRLTCELASPRLADLRHHDRWIGAKAAAGLRAGLAGLLGPRHTWLKLAALLACVACVYLGVATGEYRIQAPFVLQPTRQQVVPAPFRGEIEAVFVAVGDEVRPGQKLARLKTLPLSRRLNALEAELFEHRKQADAARSEKKWAEAQMAAARVRQLTEQTRMLAEQIEQATVRAMMPGTVVRGDLERLIGASVETGHVLFEIAQIGSLRAELSVDEDQIADLAAAMRAGKARGEMAAVSFPDRPVPFVVERILPAGDPTDGQVVFKARAALGATRAWMRPGMAGVARVELGRRRLAWIWGRRLVNWLRLRLWL